MAPLSAYDEQYETDLVTTIEAYLANDGNVTPTADAAVHPPPHGPLPPRAGQGALRPRHHLDRGPREARPRPQGDARPRDRRAARPGHRARHGGRSGEGAAQGGGVAPGEVEPMPSVDADSGTRIRTPATSAKTRRATELHHPGDCVAESTAADRRHVCPPRYTNDMFVAQPRSPATSRGPQLESRDRESASWCRGAAALGYRPPADNGEP